MEYVVFAIDHNRNNHHVAKFEAHMDKARAMGKMLGQMVRGIGCWEGILEQIYICTKSDYLKHAAQWAPLQECVLVVNEDARQPAYTADAATLQQIDMVGPVRHVTASEAMASMAWTYNAVTGKYFVAG